MTNTTPACADHRLTGMITSLLVVAMLVIGTLFISSGPGHAQVGPLNCGTAETGLGHGTQEVTRVTSHVGMTWAGHFVDQALLTTDDAQYVGYYNADRQLTVAHRHLGSDAWTETQLGETIAWDSHNYITIALDRAGHLHVAGNMHDHPLKYFRTTVAGDVTSLERVTSMVDPALEGSVTYPVFLELDDGTLIFRYREGGSGSGIDIYNQYDEATETWSGLLDLPLLDGQGVRNAYAAKPRLGPDGNYHMVWVWRETPNAATTNTVSYARSADLVQWETSTGEPLALPITRTTGDVVDPVPPFGGVINNNVQVGFDPHGAPVVAYHRYDEAGNTQVYVARPDDSASGWQNVQVSDWTGAWEFSAGGTLVFEVEVYWSPEVTSDGMLRLDVTCQGDARTFLIDGETLEPRQEIITPPTEPGSVTQVRSDYVHPPSGEVGTDMQVNLNDDSGGAGPFHARPLLPDPDAELRHLLRWESLGENQDLPRGSWPPAQPLEVVTLEPGGPNLALNPTGEGLPLAFADHFQSQYPPTNLNDGDRDSFWVSAGTQAGDGPSPDHPVTVGVELDEPTVFNEITLVPRPGAARHPRDFTVEVSETGHLWTPVANVVDAPTSGDIVVPFPRVVAGAVRLVVTASYPGALLDQAPNTQLSELEIRSRDPRVTADFSPAEADGRDGWYVTPVTMTVTSTTDDALRWRIGPDAPWTQLDHQPLRLEVDGVHHLSFDAFVGDLSAPRWTSPSGHRVLGIDTTPPSTSATEAGRTGPDGRWDGAVTITLTASDATSGVAETRYRTEGDTGAGERYDTPLTVTGPGTHRLEFRSVDVAGNLEAWNTITVEIADDDDGTAGPPAPTAICARHQGKVTFPDAAGSGHQYFIDCLAALEVVGGFTDGTYGPRGEVTRAQLASFVVRAIERATGTTMTVGSSRFTDVAPGSTHGAAIAKLKNAGIIQGYRDGRFAPTDAVTRDQTARYVTNALEYVLESPLPTSAARFPDVLTGNRYAVDIDKLVTAEVVGGFADGTFGPRLSVTRAQMARFIGNALEVIHRHGAYDGP